MNKFYNSISSKLENKLHFDVKYLLRGSFWMTIGHILTVVSVLATSYFFANYLSPETYGLYKYVLTVGILLSAFTLSGIGTTVIQAAAKSIDGYLVYAQTQGLKYSIFMSVSALTGSYYYAINDNQLLSSGLIIIAVLQPLMNSSTLIFGQLIGEQRFKDNNTAHLIKLIITSLSIILAILYSGELWVILLVFFLSNIISNVLAQLLFDNFAKKNIEKEKVQIKKLTNFAKHVSLQGIITKIANNLDKILIFQNLGAVELATYSFATALPDQYKGFTKSIENMVLPRFSNYSEKTVKSNLLHKSFLYFLLLIFVCFIYMLAAPYIFNIFFPTYTESVLLSQVYVLGTLSAIGSLPLQGLKATLAKKRLYLFTTITALFQILTLIILLPIYGLMGAIIARVAYRTFVAISAYIIYFYKPTDINKRA